jgi:hypothetical protein
LRGACSQRLSHAGQMFLVVVVWLRHPPRNAPLVTER